MRAEKRYKMSTIHLARDFSSTPGGRFRNMGPGSGEEFREYLLRALKKNKSETVTIILDGAEGYGSSFLEEAFGGLVRLKALPADEIMNRVKVVANSPQYETYAFEAHKYMVDAAKNLS